MNVPAVAAAGIPDALEREPGTPMISALGRTGEQFNEIRRAVGERAWWSLYMGMPSSPEGGLIKREWLQQWRLPASPQRPTYCVVGVDPSDSGQGDSCGIVAASIGADGVVAVITDVSAPMTSDQWARAAVELALDVGASEISIEAYSARETYQRVAKDALKRYKIDRPIKVSAWPPKGSGRGGGDSIARSSALIQGFEVGTVLLAGHHLELEEAAVQWQQGQHQPDCLAALVVAHDVLIHAVGQIWNFVSPIDLEKRRREMERDPARSGRFAGRLGSRDLSPVDPRLRQRVSGNTYNPLAHLGQILG